MSTRTILSMTGRLAGAAACVISLAGCGGEMLRTGRAPMFLVIDNMSATAGKEGGGATATAFLLSDVQTIVEQDINGQTVRVATVFNDSATATIRAQEKNPSATATQINGITLTRYHIDFRRTDGRNTPGVDVPYSFDGGLGVTINPGNAVDVAFEIVRHQSKEEPPLKNLVAGGGLRYISTIAEVTFYGRDHNGNEVAVTGRIDVQFADFGDE